MPVTSVVKDPHALTMTVVADFAASRQRLWEAYTDPRQIEKFWGPPTWPATFLRHDVFPGGRSHYFMTGPDGTVSGGYWEFLAVEPGRSFEVRDGFADAEGRENDEMPSMRMVFTFEDTADGSRLTTKTWFASTEELEQLLEMGMEEGLKAAMGQIDDVLADLASFARTRPAEARILSDTRVRISRVIRGSVEQVWKAHTDAAWVKRWMSGPDGWTMPVCEVASAVGERYRYRWEPADPLAADTDTAAEGAVDAAADPDPDPGAADRGGEVQDSFGFTGEVLEIEPPHRMVTTEQLIGHEGPPNVNVITLTPRGADTLLCLVVTYPSKEVRDAILATGMIDGMEASYARLEAEVLG